MRDENDEPVFTYKDELMRHFVRQSIKGGRCSALNQYYKLTISDQVFNIMSQEKSVDGNISEISDKYFEFTIDHRKTLEDKYDSHYKDNRDIDQEEGSKYISEELNELPIHKKLQKLNRIDVMMDLDATNLYPSALWDENSVYPKIESGFAFKPHMNNVHEEAFNIQSFNPDGERIKYYNPPNLVFQHFPVKEKVKNIEDDRMKKGYNIDTLTSVDICEIVKNGGRIIEIYEGVLYRENFKTSPFSEVIEKLFALRQKYKNEHNDLMQRLVNLFMNSFYGVQIRKDINQSYKCISQHWMETEYDGIVLDYWRLPNGNYIVNSKKDDALDGDNDVKNTLPSQLDAFIVSNSKRIMNKIIRGINELYNNSIYYGDTHSVYIEKKI